MSPLFFNINFCHLFLSDYSSEFFNFADDTTPYKGGKNYDEVINKLEDTIEKLLTGFSVTISRQMHLNIIFIL